MWSSISESEEKALNVTLNNRAIQGDWTAELGQHIADLKSELSEEEYLELQIKALESEIPEDDVDISPEKDPDHVPDMPAKPKSETGIVYVLGRHRVMCGDATKREDYATLLGKCCQYSFY